jgi:hypothetical protein
MTYEDNIYPNCDNGHKSLYYVEFDRGNKNGEFTIFRRQFMYTEEELVEWEKKSPKDIFMLRMCNEVHPWNIFTARYGSDNSVPDRTWVKWMVDALNEKVDNEKVDNDKSVNCSGGV